MALLGGELTYRALTRWVPAPPALGASYDSEYVDARSAFGPDFFERIEGRDVMDFGCGKGELAVEMARHGARSVLGVDMQPRYLALGRQLAERTGAGRGAGRRCHRPGRYAFGSGVGRGRPPGPSGRVTRRDARRSAARA